MGECWVCGGAAVRDRGYQVDVDGQREGRSVASCDDPVCDAESWGLIDRQGDYVETYIPDPLHSGGTKTVVEERTP
jgi:hypothetical protein